MNSSTKTILKNMFGLVAIITLLFNSNLNAQTVQTCSASASGLDDGPTVATYYATNCNITQSVDSVKLTFTGSTTYCSSWYDYNLTVNGVTIMQNVCQDTLNGFNLTLAGYTQIDSISISSNDADGYSDFVTVSFNVEHYLTPAPLDVKVLSLARANNGCATTTESMAVTFQNNGSQLLDFSVENVVVGFISTQTNALILADTITSGTLASIADTTYNMVNTISLDSVGTYDFTVFAYALNEVVTDNDTLTNAYSYTNTLTYATPISVDFAGFTGSNLSTVFPGWREGNTEAATGTSSSWTSSNNLGQPSARINLYTTSRREWIVSPKFVASPQSLFKYKVAVTDFANGTPAVMGSDDTVRVMISTNCGLSWDTLTTYTTQDALTNAPTIQSIALGGYAGQTLQVAFYATDGPINDPEDFDFHVTDLYLGDPLPAEFSADAILTPSNNSGCLTATEAITVKITNNGDAAADYSIDSLIVTAIFSGDLTDTITEVYTVGTLAPVASDTLTLSNTVDLSAAGTYNVRFAVTLVGDVITTNDTSATVTINNDPIYATPGEVNFDGFTGSNLSTVFPGWKEGRGVGAPTIGTTSDWTNTTVLGQTTARLNLYNLGSEEWIYSPKYSVVANDSLFLDIAITNYLSATPDVMGADDAVYVMISTDCGGSFTAIDTFTVADNLTNSLTTFKYDLTPYAGNNVIVGIWASEGTVDNTEDYDVHIDNLFIGDFPDNNLAVVELIEPSSYCGSAATPVDVVITNLGTIAQTGFTVNADITGGFTQNFSITYSGTLAPGEVDTVTLGTVNTLAGGIADVLIYTGLANDEETSNDSLLYSNVEFYAIPAAPTAMGDTICAGDSASLMASNGAVDYAWFDAAFGGTELATGATYSPVLTATDTFYVETFGSQQSLVGAPSTAIGSTGTFTTFTSSIYFDVTSTVTIDSVTVYPGSSGDIVFNVTNTSNVVLHTVTVPVTVNTPNEAVRIPIGITLTPGSYRTNGVGSTVSNLIRNSSGANYPYQDASGSLTMTNTTAGTSYVYFFYNWAVTARGCSSDRTQVIATVNDLPVVDLGADTLFCFDASIAMTLDAGTATSYLWNDGSTNQTLAVSDTGMYSVEITNASGCTAMDSIYIGYYAPVTVDLGADTTICDSEILTLSAGNYASYTWSDNSTNATLMPTATGTYAVTVADANGCAATDSIVVTVNAAPTSAIADALFCEGDSAIVTTNQPMGTTFAWSNGSTADSAVFTMGGTYTVTVTNTNNCSVVDTVVVTEAMNPSFSLGADTAFCANDSLVLMGPANGINNYLWSNGATTADITVNMGGTYTLGVVDTNGCIAADTVVVTVNALPVISINDANICGNSSAVINASQPAGTIYNWSNGATTASITVNTAGTYSVTVTNINGCTASDDAVITQSANPTVSLGNDTTICSGETITLDAGTGFASYAWSTAATTSSISVSTANTYTVTVTDANGCTGSDAIVITLTNCGGVNVNEVNAVQLVNLYPNPNNGTFVIEPQGFSNLAVTVVDATGKLVYNQTGINATQEFNLNNLSKGLYLVNIQSAEGATQTFRMIVE